MRVKEKSDFRYYVPLEISKGKDKLGNETMIVKGIASTLDRDSDGEIIDPNGFDFTPLLNSGFINWHHQQKNDPDAVIGEPTKAYVKNNQFHVEAQLYPWQPLAQKVWSLANNLAKAGSKRKLGWSIEGKATERDLMDTKYVKKSLITGIAITPIPKNAATILDVVKGEGGFLGEENGFEEEFDLEKGNIFDIENSNGDKIIVDRDFNVIVKAFDDKDKDEEEKAMTTATSSGKTLMRESLEGSLKNISTSKEDIKTSMVLLSKACENGLVKAEKMINLRSEIMKNLKTLCEVPKF